MSKKKKISIVLIVLVLISVLSAYMINAAGKYSDDVINNGAGTSYDLSAKERKKYYDI